MRFNNLIPGRYITTWGSVPYYVAPAPRTNSLAENGSLLIEATYLFPDENFNDMSDLWEMTNFSEVSFERTILTDTDLDGATDYEEFIAGTDPKKPGVNLRLKLPVYLPVQNRLRLEWASSPGRIYRVEGLTVDLNTWVPLTGWLPSTGTNSSATIPAPNPVEPDPYTFRLEVKP